MIVLSCCECVRELPTGKRHLSIMGCHREGERKTCDKCEETESCSIRLVYPDDASHGFCLKHFRIAMKELDLKRQQRRDNAKKSKKTS